MAQITREQVCERYGIADRELDDFLDSPAGFTFTTTDGIRYIDVNADTPDYHGKTGLMYLDPPVTELGYNGDFPVYVPEPDEDDEPVAAEAKPLTKAQQKAADKAAAAAADAENGGAAT